MIGLLLAGFTPLMAQVIPGSDDPLMTTTRDLRAKAEPDECFRGLGLNKPFAAPPCSDGIPKVNQAYVWAIAEAGDDVWFGTFANGHCVTAGTLAPDPQNITSHQTPSYVCEFGAGPFSPSPLPPAIGDFRPPQMFVYNKATKTHVNVTPTIPGNPLQPLPLVQQTLGIRAAARFGNLVILGGPSLLGGINLFAFRSDTRRLVGARNFPEFNEIRQWLNSDNNLYAAVGKTEGGGAVLNWKGTVESPFQYEVVGNTDGFGAYLAKHEGRIFVITWPPYRGGSDVISSLYMSPPVLEGGLTPADAEGWTKVWQASDYEPDPLVASRYAGGLWHPLTAICTGEQCTSLLSRRVLSLINMVFLRTTKINWLRSLEHSVLPVFFGERISVRTKKSICSMAGAICQPTRRRQRQRPEAGS